MNYPDWILGEGGAGLEKCSRPRRDPGSAPKSHFTANAKTLDRESIVVTLFYFAQDTQQQWNRQKGEVKMENTARRKRQGLRSNSLTRRGL